MCFILLTPKDLDLDEGYTPIHMAFAAGQHGESNGAQDFGEQRTAFDYKTVNQLNHNLVTLPLHPFRRPPSSD